MRRVIPGSKSERARSVRQTVRDEVAERLQEVGIPIGGFTGDPSSVRSTMSDGLRRQIALNEEREARAQAELEHERQVRVERFADSASRHAIAMALEAGEEFHPRMLAGQGLGHTVRELIETVSDRQDIEDQRIEAAELEEFRRWKAAKSAGLSGDVSAPTAQQLEAQQLTQQRAERFRQKINRRVEAREIAHEEALKRAEYERRHAS
jgi:hypothetical protein